VKFGTRLYGIDPDGVAAKAQSAEELGFESLWRGEHLLLPDSFASRYPYNSELRNERDRKRFPPTTPLLDPLILFAYIAQATTTIRLATGIFVLPLRDPIPVARAVQTLDIVSGGRFTFGIGIGWLEEEFDLIGRSFRGRGSVTDEAICLLKTLWTDVAPEFTGEHFELSGARFEPKPVQKPHPPIVCGGESPAALRRAARFCNGWYGHRKVPEEAAETVRKLDLLRNEFQRQTESFEVTVRVYSDVELDQVRRLEEVGVDRVVLEIGGLTDLEGDRDLEEMKRFADRVVQDYA
jgi:probable F420-dependent oxidoreductase